VDQHTVIDLPNRVAKNGERSDPSRWLGGSLPPDPVSTAQVRYLEDGAFVMQSVDAHDPYVSLAPDLDLTTAWRVARRGDVLEVSSQQVGDGFPSSEALMRDPSNQTILLSGFKTSWTGAIAAAKLAGDADTLQGYSGLVEVKLDDDGNFVAVRQAAADPTRGWMTVEQWNRRVHLVEPEAPPAPRRWQGTR